MKNVANYLTPDVLNKINRLNDLDITELPRIPYRKSLKFHIYFLFYNEELVYIGKTTNIQKRLSFHFKNKTFNSYSVLEVKECDLDLSERVLINKYLPKLNNDMVTKKIKNG